MINKFSVLQITQRRRQETDDLANFFNLPNL